MGDCSDSNRAPGLTCKDVNDFLVVYLEDALERDVSARFEAHLHRCPQCTSYLEQYRALVELVQEADDAPAPPEMLVEYTLAFLRQHYERSDRAP